MKAYNGQSCLSHWTLFLDQAHHKLLWWSAFRKETFFLINQRGQIKLLCFLLMILVDLEWFYGCVYHTFGLVNLIALESKVGRTDLMGSRDQNVSTRGLLDLGSSAPKTKFPHQFYVGEAHIHILGFSPVNSQRAQPIKIPTPYWVLLPFIIGILIFQFRECCSG